ncbi:MAG TPA: N-acetylmuramoyl-L-alanine amidase [Rhodanobacteraceae bacterium]|nr:N-acetylmuramoyl-L-alanine amidase [Rhodanobacteraceae bacterium]
MKGILRPWLSVLIVICGVLACVASAVAAPAAAITVNGVRVWGGPDSTRVVMDLSGPAEYKLFQLDKPDRVVLDLDDSTFAKGVGDATGKGVVKDVRVGHYQGKARIVLDLDGPAHPKSFLLTPAGQYGYRLIVDLGTPSGKAPQIVRTIDDDVAHDKPRPVVIAVDAGHGGDDPGARGRDKTLEKTVTLEIAKDLAKLIDAQPGMQAVLTRDGDYFVPLKKRFQIARSHKADLFVSIHANSCPDYCDARGASVWVLSTHGKQSEAGRWLANSENASDLIGGVSLDDKNHMLASVLLDLSQGASMHAAHEVGGDVLDALGKIGPLYRDSVQGANFVVLRSPDVPSILVETAFISNLSDEKRLDNPRDRERLAKAILVGVKQYFQTTPPPGTWFAAQRDQRLHIPSSAPLIAKVDTSKRDTSNRSVALPGAVPTTAGGGARDAIQDMHKVTRGETLSGIAQQYGVSLRALRQVNSGKIQSGGAIQAGAVLLIPNS